MGRNWQAFLGALEKDHKKFAEAVVDHLDPPKYAIEQLRKLDYLCHFCWSPRMDYCFLCLNGVCEEHAKTYVGEKTKLEWYVCPNCQEVHSEKEILKRVGAEDEEYWLEDQEAAIDLLGRESKWAIERSP